MPTRPRSNVQFEIDEFLSTYDEQVAILDHEAQVSRKEIWYQHNEMSHIKRKAMVVARDANKYGLGSLLTNTYGCATDVGVIGSVTQEALNTWVRNGNSRRGLERWINEEYAAKRADIRRRTIQSVLRVQEKMRDEDCTDPDYRMKVISRLSEAFSVDSRNFARGMALADELAAREVHNVDSSSDEESSTVSKEPASSSRKAPSRTASPASVMNPPRQSRRNLGLSMSAISSSTTDFRHFY